MGSKQKQQSAIEYLMTYGWAILIIVVVLALLFAFNIFNSNSLSTNNCRSFENFVCTALLLNSSGYLNINLGAYGPTVTATGIACTNNSAPAPVSFYSLPNIKIQSALSYSFIVQCPASQRTIGSKFDGVVWLRYNSGNELNLIAEIAAFSATASTQNPVSTVSTTSSTSTTSTSTTSTSTTSTSTTSVVTTTVYYAMVGITNNQNVATPAPFQVLIDVPSSSYSGYINPNWNNVKFTTSADGAGTALEAWVEENATNTAGSTPVWITLPSGMSANSSISISMNFMPTNVMNATCAAGANPETNPSTCDTGEAPQLSSTYAQYDNGANVFTFYDGFAGTSLSSKWTVSTIGSGATAAVSDGLTIQTTQASSGIGIFSSSAFAYPLVSEADITAYSLNCGSPETMIFESTNNVMDTTNYAEPENSYLLLLGGSGTNIGAFTVSTPSGTTNLYSGEPIPSYPFIFGVTWIATGNEVASIGSANYPSADTTVPIGNYYLGLANNAGGCLSTGVYQWFRGRAYPPNGVMPTSSFGSVV